MLWSDLYQSEAETLFIFLYNIFYFQDGRIEVHFPLSDGDRNIVQMKDAFGWILYGLCDLELDKTLDLTDHLAENPLDEVYEPLKIYIHDDEVSFVGKDISDIFLAGDYSLREWEIIK